MKPNKKLEVARSGFTSTSKEEPPLHSQKTLFLTISKQQLMFFVLNDARKHNLCRQWLSKNNNQKAKSRPHLLQLLHEPFPHKSIKNCLSDLRFFSVHPSSIKNVANLLNPSFSFNVFNYKKSKQHWFFTYVEISKAQLWIKRLQMHM